jgi:hypothetical protein
VRPHSRYEVERSAAYQRHEARLVLRGGRRVLSRLEHWEMKTSTRPILRDELLQRLRERLVEMLKAKVNWRATRVGFGDVHAAAHAASEIAKLLAALRRAA